MSTTVESPSSRPAVRSSIAHMSPACLLGAALLVGLGKVLSGLGHPFYNWGDQAIIELQVRKATHLAALVGPYDRFGWHHLGPAYFYALAPLYVLLGHSSRSLSASDLLINGASACAALLVVARRQSWRSAAWFGALIGVYLLAIGAPLLIYPWNPLVLALPMLLCFTLSAEAWTGSLPCLAWAILVGTFLVQAEISTLPMVAFTLIVGTAGLAWGRSRPGSSGTTISPLARELVRPGTVIALLLAALLWTAPIYQQLSGHPGNLSLIWGFFTSQHPDLATHSLRASVGSLSNALTLRHLGQITPAANPSWLRAAALIFDVADAIVVLAVGLRSRNRLVCGLAVLSLGGTAVAVISIVRILGPIEVYLVAWMAATAFPAWLATGLIIGRRLGAPTQRRCATAVALITVVPLGLLAHDFATGSTTGFVSYTDVPAIAAPIMGAAHAASTRSVTVRIAQPDRYAVAAGVVLYLTKAGFTVYVGPTWANTFDQTGDPPRTPITATLSDASSPAAGVSGPSGITAVTVKGP